MSSRYACACVDVSTKQAVCVHCTAVLMLWVERFLWKGRHDVRSMMSFDVCRLPVVLSVELQACADSTICFCSTLIGSFEGPGSLEEYFPTIFFILRGTLLT
jgi:hypothetical protein